MTTTRTVVHGPGGSTTVTERTSYTSGGDFGDDFGDDFGSDSFGGGSRHHQKDGFGHRIRTIFSGGGGRRSRSGWGTRHGGSEPKRPSGPPMKLEGKTYDEIKAECLRENRLFEDPDFPPNDSSVFPSKRPPRPFEWKRPTVSKYGGPPAQALLSFFFAFFLLSLLCSFFFGLFPAHDFRSCSVDRH